MRALLASPLGFLIGLSLGALGGGGSILAIPALVYGAGLDPKAATTTSLLLVGTAALVGLGRHWRAGRVCVGVGLAFGLAGIGGSLAGSAVNHHSDPDLLLLMFAGLVAIAAWRMATGCPTCTTVGDSVALEPAHDAPGAVLLIARPQVDIRTAAAVLTAGTVVGFLTGLFGVGGGFVIVPALALLLKLPMPQAIGTSLLVIAVNSSLALATRFATTAVEWGTALPFVVAAIAGVVTGGHVADRLDPRRSLRWFAALLVAVAAYTAIRAGSALLS